MLDFEFAEFVSALEKFDAEKTLYFLKNGMDVNYKAAEKGTTLLLFVINSFNKKISEILSDEKSDENRNLALDEIEKKALATISVLLENGADVNDADCIGYTPLLFVIGIFSEKIATIPLNKKSNEEQIAALEMIAPKVMSLVSIFLKNGANTNCEASNGDTPLGLLKYNLYLGMLGFLPSAMDGDIGEKKTAMKTLSKILEDIETLLVEAGADENRLNQFGETPRQYADRIMFEGIDKRLPPEENDTAK